MRAARRAATTDGSSCGAGGFSAAVCSGAVDGDVTDGEDGVGVAPVEVATGGGVATAGLVAGGGTVDVGLVRLRRTTTGFVMGLCARPGMRPLFLGSTGNARRCRKGARPYNL
jgi:hypothetical protein